VWVCVCVCVCFHHIVISLISSTNSSPLSIYFQAPTLLVKMNQWTKCQKKEEFGLNASIHNNHRELWTRPCRRSVMVVVLCALALCHTAMTCWYTWTQQSHQWCCYSSQTVCLSHTHTHTHTPKFSWWTCCCSYRFNNFFFSFINLNFSYSVFITHCIVYISCFPAGCWLCCVSF